MSDFTFIPVSVNRGRKFRGLAYVVDGGYTYTRGYRNSGVDPYQATDYAKLWDPVNRKFAYCNADFTETREVDAETLAADKKAFADAQIAGIVEWCRVSKPASTPPDDLKSFTRAVLLKRLPFLRERIDAEYPDNRSAFTEVKKTLEWAVTLVSQATVIYGKRCPGGTPYPPRKKVRIAYKALRRKGVTILPDFPRAWEMCLTIFALPIMTPETLEAEICKAAEKYASENYEY